MIFFQVSWYRDTLKLDTNERRITEVRGSRHTLIVRKVQASDFGNYSCVADNVVGKSRAYVELSGKHKISIKIKFYFIFRIWNNTKIISVYLFLLFNK